MDEITYMEGGLVLWEGITPGMRVAPAAPQTWITWLYAATRSAESALHPDASVAQASWQTRPFLIINSILFDIYQDMSGLRHLLLTIELIVAIGGSYGAFQLGAVYGQVWGGFLTGGLVALLPLYVEFAGMSRSYSDAWGFAFLTLYSAAAVCGKRRWIQTGIFLALSVGSRIDMLAILPLVIWLFWDNSRAGDSFRPALKAVLLGAVITLLMSPWLTIGPVGILRTLVTTRAMAWTSTTNPRLETLLDLTWQQGLGPAILMIGFLLIIPRGQRIRRWLLAIVAALLVLPMFVGPYQPMRYHGGPIIAILTLVAVSSGEVVRRWPKAAMGILGAMLLLPAAQTASAITSRHSLWVPDQATAWVEQHVPAGTRVYDPVCWDLRCPLPTSASADAAWDQVTDDQAWRKKFAKGLSRFGLSASDMPRALSEDNLVLDRGDWRRYFILGSNLQPDRPRYDLQPIGISQVFGVQNLPQDFVHNGGVVIWRAGDPPTELGKPVIQWTNSLNQGTFIYCSPEVLAKLKE